MRHFLAKHLLPTLPCKPGTAAVVLITTALLSACGTPGGEKPKSTPPPVIENPQQDFSGGSARELPASEFASQFVRAEQSLFEFDWMAADSILVSIAQHETSVTDDQYLGYMQARILYVRGDQPAARQQLSSLYQTTQNAALRHKMLSFQRYMSSLSGSHLEGAQLGNQLLVQTSPGPEYDTLRRGIWKDLQQLQAPQLQSAINSAADQQWRGWLELARISAQAKGDLELEQALQQWRSSNPQHPAAQVLPGGMDYLLSQTSKPKKVTILLPLSGRLAPAAQAVRDGYLSAYYAAHTSGTDSFDLDILDVLAFSSVTEAYTTALANGAEFIVGPLSKQAVEELGNLPNRQLPVLALNRIDKTLPTGDTALVQLALAPEDEAAQIASLAFGQGARRALIIRPAGSWGDKMERALKKQWHRLGGTVSATASYSSREDQSSSVSTALSLPASERRAREVRSMLATNVEFTARRRADIDLVFLLSKSGVEARSLKPLLDYHYASDLPVYATSNIYRGVADKRDRDLNGIQLVETPWLLGANPEARAAISAGGIGSNSYTRLNALGVDAYLLQTHFSGLQAGEELLIRGNTGLLSLDPQLHIKRELQSATFDGGTLIAQ
jgi:outer membrane PBP1 activator LpoA protein